MKIRNLRDEPPVAYFQGGTIVLDSLSERDLVPDSFQWVSAKWRYPAVHYRAVLPEGVQLTTFFEQSHVVPITIREIDLI